MVVALVALFVALGGTGYAAGTALLTSKPEIIKIVKSVAPSLKVGGLTPLKSGQSESGTFSGSASASGDWLAVTVDYPHPLKTQIPDNHVIEVTSASGTHCAGAGHADPGYFCFYNTISAGVSPLDDVYSGANETDVNGKLGLIAYWQATGTHPYVGGTWTVTAP
jgi:hypothetical protein